MNLWKHLTRLSLFLVLLVSYLNCQKKPIEIKFYNIKGHENVSNTLLTEAKRNVETGKETFRETFPECKGGLTKKPGVIFVAALDRKLGTHSIQVEVINLKDGSIRFKQDLGTNPDIDDLNLPYTFRLKGDFLVNFIVKDEIIAQGKITYE